MGIPVSDLEGSTMIRDDAVNESEAHSGTPPLGGEERLSEHLHVFGRQSDAVVLNLEDNIAVMGGHRDVDETVS